ncbi:MAG TPA: alkaline phosphatase [Polyangiaceae bacterium LLY-WYZ-14_1]|nr:alkaline phosphatase [Polyangiaceae bacterium LLY-WYZ-14_1]
MMFRISKYVLATAVLATMPVLAGCDEELAASVEGDDVDAVEAGLGSFGGGFGRTGNAIFIHPDGSALNHWNAARMFWEGADGALEWDRMPATAVYRGHMSDQLTGTSNGGATAHGFGYKPQGPESYGRDRGREILALSGYPGSFLREAGNRGRPIGIVNDGDVAGEPGTGAFLAETDNRGQPELHSLQLLAGRPGFNGPTDTGCSGLMDGIDLSAIEPGAVDCDITDGEDEDPQVILGGGERFFLPVGIPQCTTAPTLDHPELDCFVHKGAEEVGLPTREDGRNLLQEARADGWVVIRTRAEFDELMERIRHARWPWSRFYAPKVLGLFANNDMFNDEEEETLIDRGIIRADGDPLPYEVADLSEEDAKRKIGRLVLWGARFNDPENPFGFNPPTPAEMMEMALLILERKADLKRTNFALVAEVESTDNMPNNHNGIGTLRALKRADDLIGVARDFVNRTGAFRRDGDPRTLLITAADSDGSGMQVNALRGVATSTPFNPIACDEDVDDPKDTCETPNPDDLVTFTTVNPQFSSFESFGDDIASANSRGFLDGIEGRETSAFLAAPDALSDARTGGDEAFANFDETGLGSFGGGTVTDANLEFGLVWGAINDTAGGIVTRAEGLNARLLNAELPIRFLRLGPDEKPFYVRFDNTDIYRMVYLTLFGEALPTAVGQVAPNR